MYILFFILDNYNFAQCNAILLLSDWVDVNTNFTT